MITIHNCECTQIFVQGHTIVCVWTSAGGKVMVLRGHESEASDSDWHHFKLYPSVLCNVNIPENINDSFYDSTVTVTLKNSVFEKSTPLRHQAEKENSVAIWNPIECSFSDGGPDHNPRNYSIKIGHLTHFLKVDLDMSVSVVTYPGGSYTNPAKRAMPCHVMSCHVMSTSQCRGSRYPEWKWCQNMSPY